MGCCPDECEVLLPTQDPGLRFYCVLAADDDGEPVSFAGEDVSLVLDPQNDDLDRIELAGVVSLDGYSVTFDEDETWSAANLTPGAFYEVRLLTGTAPDRQRVGPVMGLRVNRPSKGVLV